MGQKIESSLTIARRFEYPLMTHSMKSRCEWNKFRIPAMWKRISTNYEKSSYQNFTIYNRLDIEMENENFGRKEMKFFNTLL